jgi:hypothetical protein
MGESGSEFSNGRVKKEILMDREIDLELIIRTSAGQPGNSTVLKIHMENSGVSPRT